VTGRLYPRTCRLFALSSIYGDGGYQRLKSRESSRKNSSIDNELNVLLPQAVLKFCLNAEIVERIFPWISRFRRMARNFRAL
jgi:hypothetical protein